MKTILTTFTKEDRILIQHHLDNENITYESDLTPEWVKRDLFCNISLFVNLEKESLKKRLIASKLPAFHLFEDLDIDQSKMEAYEDLTFTDSIESVIKRIQDAYLKQDNRTWIIAFSGGKDSTLLGICVWKALERLPVSLLKRKVIFITSDTGLEHKRMRNYMGDCVRLINEKASQKGLDMIESHLVEPKFEHRFGPKVVGRGMPIPTPQNPNQWCTDNWKIKPANDFIKRNVEKYGEVVIFTGGRKDESKKRSESLSRNSDDGFIFPKKENNKVVKGQYACFAIQDISNEEVWYTLKQFKPYDFPWGISYDALFKLYENTGECPMQLTKNNSNCGNSRNGCVLCMMPKDDLMLEFFKKQGEAWAEPIITLRTKIRDMLNDANLRRHPKKFKTKNDLDQFNPFIEKKHEIKDIRNAKKQSPLGKELMDHYETTNFQEAKRLFEQDRKEKHNAFNQRSTGLLSGTKPVYPDNAAGSHSLKGRIYLFKNILYYQQQAGLELIKASEIPFILDCWKEEFGWVENNEDLKPEPVDTIGTLRLKEDYTVDRGKQTTIPNLVLPPEHNYKSGKPRISNRDETKPLNYLHYVHRDIGLSEKAIVNQLLRSEGKTGETIPYFFNNAWKDNDGNRTYWNVVTFVLAKEEIKSYEDACDYVEWYLKQGKEDRGLSWSHLLNA